MYKQAKEIADKTITIAAIHSKSMLIGMAYSIGEIAGPLVIRRVNLGKGSRRAKNM